MPSAAILRYLPMWAAALGFATASWAAPPTSKVDKGDLLDVQAAVSWLYPLNSPNSSVKEVPDGGIAHIPGSRLGFTGAQLRDLFSAPDWHPQSHSAMPEIVIHGRPPGTYACGYCHMPAGQGRPENAPLAGLPAAYIVRQVADIKAGTRRSAWHGGPYAPIDLMHDVAANVAEPDLNAAAEYFSAQTLRLRVTVIERERIPRMRVMAWVYVIDPRGGEDSLGQRLIEWAPDFGRHERRDDEMRYNAFVPPGSVERGRTIAMTGHDAAQRCNACHGDHLQGMGSIPALAGRSPTYLLRQLVAFRTKDRAGVAAAPMQAVVAKMRVPDMIAVAAYAAAH
jgi:cytochrome c553